MEMRVLKEILADMSDGRQLKNFHVHRGMKTELHNVWSARASCLQVSDLEVRKFIRFKKAEDVLQQVRTDLK
jgi:hypothetical protein